MTALRDLDRIEHALTELRPEPGRRFQRRMAAAPWARTGLQAPGLRLALAAGLAALLLLVFLAATPAGRAIAQAVLGFFTTTSSRYYARTLQPYATPMPTYILTAQQVTVQATPAVDAADCGPTVSPVSSSFPCQLRNAEAELGFEVRSFAADRIDLTYQFLETDIEGRWIEIFFRGGDSFYLVVEGIGDFPAASPQMWAKVPEDVIQEVRVGVHPAEFVAGSWTSSDGINHYWDPDFPEYQLRWAEGDRWFHIERFVGEPQQGAQENLVDLAEHLVSLSQGAGKLAGADTPTVEQLAGFDVLEPAILPEGFSFCSAAYLDESDELVPGTVRLDYCLRDESLTFSGLSVYETPTTNDKAHMLYQFVSGPADLTTVQDVQVGGAAGQYLVESDGHAGLIWEAGGYQLMIDAMWYASRGGRLDPQTLIAIAESMR